MTLWEKIKQMYVSIKLETNPYYYCVVDIQQCIDSLYHLMTHTKLNRSQMKEATFYLTSLREYKNVVTYKTAYSHKIPMKDVLVDIYMEVGLAQRFIESVERGEDDEYVDPYLRKDTNTDDHK